MAYNLIPSNDPLVDTITQKRAELEALENEFAQAELEYKTLENEMLFFENQYRVIVGKRLQELDEIRARICEAIVVLSPQSESAQNKARELREQAEQSKEEAETGFSNNETPSSKEFIPSESLKKLFREVARKVHPDLAIDDDEKKVRNEFMAAANEAYRDRDEQRLKEILQDWESLQSRPKLFRVKTELERINQTINNVKRKLHDLYSQIRSIRNSELYKLKQQSDRAKQDGRDLLSEIVAEINQEIKGEEQRIEWIVQLLTTPLDKLKRRNPSG